jgi:uncharacterized protein YlxW (UPF0749 family)
MSVPAPVRTGRPSRPDASMTLLTEVMERPLDPGYAAAHARREAGEPPPRPAGRATSAAAAVVAGLALVAAVLPLRAPAEVVPRELLSQEVAERTAVADAEAARVQELRAEVDALRSVALENAGGDPSGLLTRLGVAAGQVPVAGPAVVVELDNAPDLDDAVGGQPRDGTGTVAEGRVYDVDLQVVVNGLWAAGAEAVAVDGVRLTALGAIRNAGEAILVDLQPLVPPYRVVAVGPVPELETRFAASDAGGYLSGLRQNFGVRASVTSVEEERVPGASSLRLRYAQLPDRPAGEGP